MKATGFLLATTFGLASLGWAQGDALSVQEALGLARVYNGTVRSAFLNYEIARANTRGAFSAFLPTVTPNYSLDHNYSEFYTGPDQGGDYDITENAALTASYLIWDSGERELNYRRSRLSRDAQEYNTLQTLRNVLFTVHQRFYDAVRAEEQLDVQSAQVDRAEEILASVVAGIEEGSIPAKDRLQAQADLLNAQASELGAQSRLATARADLKAVIGWPVEEDLPALEVEEIIQPRQIPYTLQEALDYGLENRADLQAERIFLESSELDIRLARINSSIQYSLRLNHTHSFSNPFDSTNLGLFFTYPLYDGGATDASLDAARLSTQSQLASLTQSERDVRADIEAAYVTLEQNIQILRAAELARDAARLNYEAVSEALAEGASDLIEVLTAQVTLVTAETNYVEAYYDTLIAEVQLQLVTGRSVPGEDEVP